MLAVLNHFTRDDNNVKLKRSTLTSQLDCSQFDRMSVDPEAAEACWSLPQDMMSYPHVHALAMRDQHVNQHLSVVHRPTAVLHYAIPPRCSSHYSYAPPQAHSPALCLTASIFVLCCPTSSARSFEQSVIQIVLANLLAVQEIAFESQGLMVLHPDVL